EQIRGAQRRTNAAGMFGSLVAEPILAAVACDRTNRPYIWMQSIRSDPALNLLQAGAVHIWAPGLHRNTGVLRCARGDGELLIVRAESWINQHAAIEQALGIERLLGGPQGISEEGRTLAVVPWPVIAPDRMMMRD